jgi:hypothetical protein
MKIKTRLIIYAVVGLPIPVISYFMFPQLGVWEPLSFVGLVVVLASVIEIVYAKKK